MSVNLLILCIYIYIYIVHQTCMHVYVKLLVKKDQWKSCFPKMKYVVSKNQIICDGCCKYFSQPYIYTYTQYITTCYQYPCVYIVIYTYTHTGYRYPWNLPTKKKQTPRGVCSSSPKTCEDVCSSSSAYRNDPSWISRDSIGFHWMNPVISILWKIIKILWMLEKNGNPMESLWN